MLRGVAALIARAADRIEKAGKQKPTCHDALPAPACVGRGSPCGMSPILSWRNLGPIDRKFLFLEP